MRILICLAIAAAAATLTAAQGRTDGPLTGSVEVTCSLGQCGGFFGWQCTGPVDLDSVTVNVDVPSGANGGAIDAVSLAAGCTGRIGKITVSTISGDGVKVGQAHDLVVGGGTITCTGRLAGKHQDGIQVLGGQRVTFAGMDVECASSNHSAFFVSGANVPTDVLFVQGKLGSTSTTVDLGTSKRSGVINSTVCPGKFFTFHVPSTPSTDGPPADNPINQNNTFPASC